MADAEFLAVSDGLHGHWSDQRDLQRPFPPISGKSRVYLPKSDRKVYAFWATVRWMSRNRPGALHIASREKLDNLIFMINCNLQRLDGPVRGNSSVIQELEGVFRGAGWNVIKVLWGGDWDELLARDTSGLLLKRMEECVDGEYQNFKARGGAYARKEFFGKYPELLKLVEDMSDEQIARLPRGGHDPVKVYNALKRATEHKGQPTVILCKDRQGLRTWAKRAKARTSRISRKS